MEKTKQHKSDAVKKLENLALDELKRKFPSFPYHVKPSYEDRTTNGLTKCVVDFKRLLGHFAERVNSMGRQIEVRGQKKFVKGSSECGSADIHCVCAPDGKSLMIEIKNENTNDVQSDEQKEYAAKIRNAGGKYIIVRNFQQLYDMVENRKKK